MTEKRMPANNNGVPAGEEDDAFKAERDASSRGTLRILLICWKRELLQASNSTSPTPS